jgi:MarR family transcriptional regulator, organic hydroperoxide resistance regulator
VSHVCRLQALRRAPLRLYWRQSRKGAARPWAALLTFHEMSSSSDLPDSSTVPESLRVLPLLWSLNAALERTSLEMETRLGVTGPQRFLLRFVGLEPGITRARLASVISLDASDLQSALDQLVAKNLLTQQGGVSGYYLTAKGAGVNAAMIGTVEQAVSKALDEATPYERSSFRRMLERVIRHLGFPH